LIPTYNNAGTILDVVRRTHTYLRDIIVVNDGCTDDTLALLGTLDFAITIVSFDRNKGKGAALKAGFLKAREMGFDYALTLDADGQHYPEDIPVLMRALDVHPGRAFIVGSRQFTDENMPGKNKFANKFSNFWFRLQTTINLPDTQTGMRIYRLDCLYGLNLLTSRYEAELELLVFAAWNNVQLVPVPIRVYYPPKEERVSHFRPGRDFARISLLNCFLCLGALLFGYVNMYWRTVCSFGWFGLTMLVIFSPFSLLYFFFRGNTPESRARYHRLMQPVAKHYCFMLGGMYYRIDNPHHIQIAEHPSVIISNHQSLLDIMIILSLSPKLAVMVKDYIWYNPVFHTVAKRLDCFPLSLEGEAKEALMRRVTEEGYSLMVFPEGTRTTTGEIGPFHRGAAYYADMFKLPIQPIIMEGLCDYMNRRQFAIKPNHVVAHILPEIPYGDRSFGPNYKKQTKSLERFYDAYLHSNQIEKSFEGVTREHLQQALALAEDNYRVTVYGTLPDDPELLDLAVQLTRKGGRII
jgi:1-acyl-sn-glycerol-3-phosphate acyltransferase